jgi:asparagine synthase (glutamine-hydrolysing)
LSTSERPKLGFPVPICHWIREKAGYERIKKAFQGAAAQQYFHGERLMRLLEEHRRGLKDNSRKLWTVYAFCVWYEIYFSGS